MRDLLRRPGVRAVVGIGVVVLLAAGWWLGSPLFIDDVIDEEFPLSATAEVPADMTQEEVEAEMEVASADPDVVITDDMPDVVMSEDDPTEPIRLLSGSFSGADDFHQGSGTAAIYQLEDGSNILRFEDFDVTNGPDLHVLLVPNEDPTGREDITGYVDLGSLKGNVGNQNYEIPADVDIDDYGSIVIYCQPFHVLFASATLSG